MTSQSRIELRPITRDNWEEVVRLKVAETQKDFVAPNVHSLAMAAYEPGLYPLAIYNEEGSMVGFIMYGWWEENKAWWIARVMVDEQHQGHGYGRTAIEKVIYRVKHEHRGEHVNLGVVPDNAGATALYESLGFVNTGETIGDEIIMRKSFAD